MEILRRPTPPFAVGFYSKLISLRDTFKKVDEHVIPAGTGFAFRIDPGHVFRIVTKEDAQVADVCVFNADDPTEHFAAGSHIALEGLQVTRLTRLWGTPPKSRPLATCLADSLRPHLDSSYKREHFAAGAHCTPNTWMMRTGKHSRNCYDNLRAALGTVGLSQRFIHDNINLFQKSALDPYTGDYLLGRGQAEPGDYIEFYAELPLLVAISLCPMGSGDVAIKDWATTDIAVHPMGVGVYSTGVKPLGWPY